jgi:hypothetical protein
VDKQSIELTYAANFGAPVMMSCKDICKLLNISKSTFYSRVVVSANFPKSFSFFWKGLLGCGRGKDLVEQQTEFSQSLRLEYSLYCVK